MSAPVVSVIRHAATWFEPSPDGFGPLLELIGDARLVLIGEASHGMETRSAIARGELRTALS
jgi:erythromycin esterase-like protein